MLIFLEIHEKLITIGLLYARIIPIFLIMPILNSGVLSSMMIRNSIIMAIIIGLWPVIDTTLPALQLDLIDIAVLVFKELLVGAALGFVMALSFWIFNGIGAFIDVARGSSMGSLIDPTNGQESTELQNFINFSVCAMYMQLGGMKLLLIALVQSFKNVGLTQNFELQVDAIAPFLGQVFAQGFVLAAPVLLTLLMTEALLGLLSRFTPQLSAFSVSMTVKSIIAIFVLSLYFFQVAPDRLTGMMHEYASWSFVKGVD